MLKAGFISQGCIWLGCRDDNVAVASRVKRTKALNGYDDDPLLLTGDTINFGIFESETLEFFNIKDILAELSEHVGGCWRDALVNQETHAQALSLERVRAITESFVNVVRGQVGQQIQNVFDGIAVG